MSTIVLITGANRGTGLGLVMKYASRLNHTVETICIMQMRLEQSWLVKRAHH
ncbi:hypothetical protein BDZ45DRAFT_754350 [Acephala macrosclerotiorum]|nr:hypothetical protein BDZ45DRAFT_754350 [Acephala macrosclerotiorum]